MFKLAQIARTTAYFTKSLTVRPPITIAGAHVAQKFRAQLHGSVQTFASHQDPHSNPLLEQLQNHPHILQQLMDLVVFLQSKGFVLGEKPSIIQVMKSMGDPEIRDKVKKLVEDMNTVGIQLDVSTITELQNTFNVSPSNNDKAHEETKDEKKHDNVMNRIKNQSKK